MTGGDEMDKRRVTDETLQRLRRTSAAIQAGRPSAALGYNFRLWIKPSPGNMHPIQLLGQFDSVEQAILFAQTGIVAHENIDLSMMAASRGRMFRLSESQIADLVSHRCCRVTHHASHCILEIIEDGCPATFEASDD